MAHTVIGLFTDSGDADIAAAHLRTEFALASDELDILGEAEWDNLTPPAPEGTAGWLLAATTGIGLQAGLGDEDPIGKRWIDQLWEGKTLVVARSNDPDIATEITREMRSLGADRVDLLPH